MNAVSNSLLVASTIYDSGIVLRYVHLLCRTEHFECCLFELNALFFANHDTARKCSNIFEHCLTTVAETGSLHGANLELCAETVDNERSERFAFYVFSNDEQGATCLYCRVKDGEELLKV